MSAASDLALVAKNARTAKEAADLQNAQAIISTLNTRAQAAAQKGQVMIEISIDLDKAIYNAIMTSKGYEYLTSAAMGFTLQKDSSREIVRIYWDKPEAAYSTLL